MLHTVSRPLVIGHRGAPGYRPEHSESAYRLAFELGADAVEPDIVVTRDGVLVVRHENEISATSDVAARPEFADRRTTKIVDGKRLTGWFTEDFTWEELQTLRCTERLPKLREANREYNCADPILRLRDVLGIVDRESAARGREFAVVLEVKHADYFRSIGIDLTPLIARELEVAGWADRASRLTIECFELGALEALRAAGVRASYVFLTERIGAPADEIAAAGAGVCVGAPSARSYAWYRSDAGLEYLSGRVHGVSIHKASLIKRNAEGVAVRHTDFVERAHARGLRVFTWTLRPENHYLAPPYRSSLIPAEWGNWQEEFSLIIASGVDAVFVDHPDLAVAARHARLEALAAS